MIGRCGAVLLAGMTNAAAATDPPLVPCNIGGQDTRIAAKGGDLMITTRPSKAPGVDIEDRAYFYSSSKWPSNKIYTCWENPEDAWASDLALVARAVKNSWQGNSALMFEGWKKCSPETQGIRIRIADAGPVTLKLGKEIAPVRDGMVLNFSFNNWKPGCRLPQDREQCIVAIVVHEFGHAIGFAHEHNRPDKPGECAMRKQGQSGDLPLTSWDPESVMNYCNRKYLNAGQLTACDIAAVQHVYGPPAK